MSELEEYCELKDQLMVDFGRMGRRERRCLVTIAKRLYAGQLQYGELSPGKKDWKREAKEEAMDMAVYLSALLEDDSE